MQTFEQKLPNDENNSDDASRERETKISINGSKYQFRVPLKWNGFDDLKLVRICTGCCARTRIEAKHTNERQKRNTMKTLNWQISTESSLEKGMHGFRVTTNISSQRNDEDWCGAQSERAKALNECVHKYARHETDSRCTRTANGLWAAGEWKVWPILVEENIGQITLGAYAAVQPWT